MTRIAGTGTTNKIFQGQRKDFIVMRKDTFEYTGTYTYVDEDNTELQYDFTSCIGAMAIKKRKTDTTAVKFVSVSFDVEEYTLFLDAEDMDMDAGKYYYDLQIYDADNKMVTKLYGDFIVLQDITDMLTPEEFEPWVYMLSQIDYEVMPSVKNNFLLESTIDYLKGIADKNQITMSSALSYAFGLRDSNTVVMSSSIFYQFMTQWFRTTLFMSSTIDYMTTNAFNEFQLMSSEIDYILTINQ